MGLKSLSIVLFGLALLTAAQEDSCLLKFSSGSLSEYRQGEGVYTQPFGSLKSLKAVEPVSPYCDSCSLTVFQGKSFNGSSQVIDFRTRIGNNSQVSWSFDAQSYSLECFASGEIIPQGETMRRLQGWEDENWAEEEEAEIILPEEQNPYPRSQIYEAVFKKMNPGDGSTLPDDIVAERADSLELAFEDFIYPRGLLPQGQYTPVKIFATEICTNFNNTYRFNPSQTESLYLRKPIFCARGVNVQVRDESGVEYRVWYIIVSFYFDGWNDLEGGLKENRLAEFPELSWKAMTESGLPSQVTSLRSRSINQAIGRMTAKNILPQGNYSVSKTNGAEYSAIVNMREYHDENDMLYRFNVTLTDASGFVSRVWVVIATNYETPQYYELIDFGYIENSLAEFTNTKWIGLNEDLRQNSINQAVNRMVAKNILPQGQGEYIINSNLGTEFSTQFDNPNYSSDEYILFNFTAKVVDSAGTGFEVYAVVIADYDDLTAGYDLLDYGKIRNS